MRNNNSLKQLKELLLRPFFSSKEAKKLGISSALLNYYIKSGQLRRIARGIYQNINYEIGTEDFQWTDLIQSIASIPNGAICLITALAIYELTDELPRQHWIAISHNTTITKRKNLKIIRFRNMSLGKTEIRLGGMLVPIFDPERTIVDAFRLLSREIAIKALKMAMQPGKKKIDLIKLQEYAKKLRFNITPYLITITT